VRGREPVHPHRHSGHVVSTRKEIAARVRHALARELDLWLLDLAARARQSAVERHGPNHSTSWAWTEG